MNDIKRENYARFDFYNDALAIASKLDPDLGAWLIHPYVLMVSDISERATR